MKDQSTYLGTVAQVLPVLLLTQIALAERRRSLRRWKGSGVAIRAFWNLSAAVIVPLAAGLELWILASMAAGRGFTEAERTFSTVVVGALLAEIVAVPIFTAGAAALGPVMDLRSQRSIQRRMLRLKFGLYKIRRRVLRKLTQDYFALQKAPVGSEAFVDLQRSSRELFATLRGIEESRRELVDIGRHARERRRAVAIAWMNAVDTMDLGAMERAESMAPLRSYWSDRLRVDDPSGAASSHEPMWGGRRPGSIDAE